MSEAELPESDSRRRFSARVDDYVRYRPHYPPALLQTLIDEVGLTPEAVVADIGSGTGFSSELFLEFGCRVIGVEPNADMRAAGDAYLSHFARFSSVEGTAEGTTLADASLDLIVAGQALHWFKLPEARQEFARVLNHDGHLAFFWNSRVEDGSPLMAEHTELMDRYSKGDRAIRHQDITPASRESLFASDTMQTRLIPWIDHITLEELEGRTLSSSYMPKRTDARADEVIADLKSLFDRYAVDGTLPLEYVTEVYFGLPRRSPA